MISRNRLTFFVMVLFLAAAAPVMAQSSAPQDYARAAGTWPNFKIYQPREVPPADLADSFRLEQLIRSGKLYLSLSDAVALALENNLDIAVARFGPREADADILRTRGGGAVRGVQTGVSTGSAGVTAVGPGAGQAQATGVTQSAGQLAVGGGGGTQVQNLDPTLSAFFGWNHQSVPQISDFVTGTNTQVVDSNFQRFNYSQAFLSGTSFQLGFTGFGRESNELRNNFNPALSSSLDLTVRQRLTQGFGRGVNSISIRVANNNREVSDLAFKQQVMRTVNNVEGLYWDLVGFVAQVEARQKDLGASEALLAQNKRKVELGLLAEVEVVRTQAQVAANRNQLAQTLRTVREQEITLKTAISKEGAGSRLADVEIVPVDRISIPEIEAVEPVQDLVATALQSRPSLAQTRIQLTNADIQLKGVRNAMLPTVDLVATATNNGLAGSTNPDLVQIPGVGEPNPAFVGGLGTVMRQLFGRRFPDYGVRFELNVPLRNRQAEADMITQSLARRRADLQLRQQENQVKLEVTQALARLQQARHSYEAALEERMLQERLLEAEESRFSLGKSSNFQIVQVQQDLARARTSEITAMTSYVKARAELDFATGRALERHNILIEEAYQGRVGKRPDPLPPPQP